MILSRSIERIASNSSYQRIDVGRRSSSWVDDACRNEFDPSQMDRIPLLKIAAIVERSLVAGEGRRATVGSGADLCDYFTCMIMILTCNSHKRQEWDGGEWGGLFFRSEKELEGPFLEFST